MIHDWLGHNLLRKNRGHDLSTSFPYNTGSCFRELCRLQVPVVLLCVTNYCFVCFCFCFFFCDALDLIKYCNAPAYFQKKTKKKTGI